MWIDSIIKKNRDVKMSATIQIRVDDDLKTKCCKII